MIGTVYEIQKFALHDGPGIRTVIFMKGCPLTCDWCSNPESQHARPQLAYDQEKCQQCHTCVQTCKHGVFSITNNKLNVNHKACRACKRCIGVCAYNALKVYGYKVSAESLIEEVLKDKAYFDNSGGGLTISGGDPLGQAVFTSNIVQAAKAQNIHTCIETSGYAKQSDLAQMVDNIDLFLYDYKLTNREDHHRYTGVYNDVILENLDYLYQLGKSIILRCPIIPGINDTKEHFEAIVALDKKYPQLMGIELMPYHDWGSHKYKQIGADPYKIIIDSVQPEVADNWIQRFRTLGCTKVKIG